VRKGQGGNREVSLCGLDGALLARIRLILCVGAKAVGPPVTHESSSSTPPVPVAVLCFPQTSRTRAPTGPREAVVVVATQLGVEVTGGLGLGRG
jgi:hypothetical protein